MFKNLTPLYQDAKQNDGGFINYLLINHRGEFGYTFARLTSIEGVIELTSIFLKNPMVMKKDVEFDVLVNHVDETTVVDADGFFECVTTGRVTQLMPLIDNTTDVSVLELYEENAIVACMVRNRIRKQIVAHSKLLSNSGKAKLMCVFADHFVTTEQIAPLKDFATKAFDVYRSGLLVGEYSMDLVDAIENELEAIAQEEV